jgi:acyl carrier protein
VKKEEIYAFIAQELKIAPSTIDDDLAMGDILEWDSLAHMSLLAAIEKKLGRSLEIEETLEIEDVASILDIMDDDAN